MSSRLPDRSLTPPPAEAWRHLTFLDRWVRIPLGFLWLVVLALLALPVCLYMTVLYHVIASGRWLVGGRPPARGGDGSGVSRRKVA